MTRLVPVLAALALLPAAAGAPALKDPPPYLPAAAGATWSYQYRGYADDPTGRELINVVTAVTQRKGVRMVCVAQVMDGGKATDGGKVSDGTWTAESADGLRHGYFSRENFVGQAWLLKLPHTRGTEWREHRDGLNEPLVLERYTARPAERVVVPAGAFCAERVDRTCEERRDGARGWSRSWYARGVGLVRWENSSGASMVLNKFTPAPK